MGIMRPKKRENPRMKRFRDELRSTNFTGKFEIQEVHKIGTLHSKVEKFHQILITGWRWWPDTWVGLTL